MPLIYSDLPDWTDASSYPRNNKYSSSQWAWEFLRRTDGYRTDWCSFLGDVASKITEAPILNPYILEFKDQGGIAKAVQEALKDLSSPEKRGDLGLVDPKLCQWGLMRDIQTSSRHAAHKWFLADMLDPTTSLNSTVDFNIAGLQSESGSEREKRIDLDNFLRAYSSKNEDINMNGMMFNDPWLNMPFQLHLTIDMRFPIGVIKEKMLKEVARRYKEAKALKFKRIQIRNRSDKYLLYLRTLDAIQAGRTNDEIGSVLFPRQYPNDIAALRKQVSNTIKAAKKTKEKYWEIAHFE
ncbi:MAG: DUF6499 domain-containing protein [Pseudomonadota bacterium]